MKKLFIINTVFISFILISLSLKSETFKATTNKNAADFIFTAKNLNSNLDVTVGVTTYEMYLKFTDSNMIIGVNKSSCVLNSLDVINIFVTKQDNYNSINFMIIPIGYKPDITMIIDYNNQYKTDFNVCVKNFSYKSQIEEYAVATAIVAKCISNYKRKKQLIEFLELDEKPEDELFLSHCYKMIDFLKSNY